MALTLQNFWFGRQDTRDKLVAAVNGTDPEAARVAAAELMLKQLYPPLQLFHRYLCRETERSIATGQSMSPAAFRLRLGGAKHPLEGAVLDPAAEPGMQRGPGAVLLGHIPRTNSPSASDSSWRRITPP